MTQSDFWCLSDLFSPILSPDYFNFSLQLNFLFDFHFYGHCYTPANGNQKSSNQRPSGSFFIRLFFFGIFEKPIIFNKKKRFLALIRKILKNVFSSGIAIGQLASILTDSREILRNETVLLFCELCEDNKDLPVLFSFESGFELLLSIMDSEGWLDGGVVIQENV